MYFTGLTHLYQGRHGHRDHRDQCWWSTVHLGKPSVSRLLGVFIFKIKQKICNTYPALVWNNLLSTSEAIFVIKTKSCRGYPGAMCFKCVCFFFCSYRGPGPYSWSQRRWRELLAPGRGAGSGTSQALPVPGRLPRLRKAAQPAL